MAEKAVHKPTSASFSSGRRHGFRLFKESRIYFKPDAEVKTGTGCQGIHGFHKNAVLPRKKTKKRPLTREDEAFNRNVSSSRVLAENDIGLIKRFKTATGRYRNHNMQL